MRAVLGPCRANRVRIVTNAGAAHPVAGARAVVEIARSLGLRGLKVAAVTGDDVLELLRRGELEAEAGQSSPAELGDARGLRQRLHRRRRRSSTALARGADVVITGRAADPALFLAPLVHELGWSMDDWTRLGRGTLVGHLLECAGQITGGYFADPGTKDVAGLARLGFPIGEVAEDGAAVITKVEGSGGTVSAATCKEQLLYEIHDPSRYLTPDVVADFSEVEIAEVGPDRVSVRGAKGHARPAHAQGFGWLPGRLHRRGTDLVRRAGRGRARPAGARDRRRTAEARPACAAARRASTWSASTACTGPRLSAGASEPYEVRARVAARTDSLEEATRIGNEVEALYTNGPAGGGGASKLAREIVGVASAFVPREKVVTAVELLEA